MKVICGKCKARLNIPENNRPGELKFKCPVCKTVNKLKVKEKKSIDSSSDATQIKIPDSFDDIMGWLVVHDENTKTQTYNLKKGKNVIGRKSESKPCDIMIVTDDAYMSRNHFAIEIELGVKGLEYLIYDVTSTNGTFINADKANRLNQVDKVLLNDGDTMQAGQTKIVLRTKKMAGTAKNATNTVINTEHLKTVIIS